MDPNLLYWKAHGGSFISRLRIWIDLLDPRSLLCSDAEIQKARLLIKEVENLSVKNENAPILSLSSFHADSGEALPFVFRPPAFLPIAAPIVLGSFLPHVSVTPALLWQFLLQTYNAGFNYANRNSSAEQEKKMSLKRFLMLGGSVAYATCAGALPQIVISRLGVRSAPLQTFFRSFVPIPLSAALAAFNVFTVRMEETEDGIQVFDSDGNPAGVSKAAGVKAVRDTALCRAALLGSSAAAPHLTGWLLQKTRLRNSRLVGPIRLLSAFYALGLMIPVTFSLFPQLGMIKREKLEEHLQAAAADGHLFYHRGL